MTKAPAIWWVRRDLRLADNPALLDAAGRGAPVIPVFICDDGVDAMGAAPSWRLGLGLSALAKALEARGSRLILRRGAALDVLQTLAAQTGAASVTWARLYDPASIARDTAVKAGLKAAGIDAVSVSGHTLFEPWEVQTGSGGFYKVYTPYWKAVKDREIPAASPSPSQIPAPGTWPESDRLEAWLLGGAMNRGAAVVAPHLRVGEGPALARLGDFIAGIVADYDTTRDIPGVDGTSGLSQNLTLGEISVRQCWQAGMAARAAGKAGAETFLKELVWRDFAHHLVYHTPRILSENWREEWEAFPWRTEEDSAHVMAWKQGRTGIPFVDAAMRQMHVTGTMHNRGRMIVASYLTKHLMAHWRIGLRWFEEHLVDWDPASNALGWQWSAGSGPDATPYFRVFNPVTQLDKFDRDRIYANAWIAEGQAAPPQTALSFFNTVPRSWGLSPQDAYPDPVVTAEEGRKQALAAYQTRTFR